ncbi:transmembrane protein 272-like isoform X1 [Styela clava]
MSNEKSYGALETEGDASAPGHSEPTEADAEAPPTYTDTTNSAPPPSYDSLFGQIKDAKDKSTGSADFLKSVCFIIFSTIGFTIFIAIMLCIPVSMIVIGAINLNNCPLERFIPIWLIVAGSVSAFMQLGSIFKKIKAKCDGIDDPEEEAQSSSVLNGFNGLIGCFNIAWFFAGNVWVYRAYSSKNTGNPVLENYCDPVTYYFAFWIITTAYIILALVCCCSCCIAAGGRK